jgi:hypothetical protein
VRERKKDRGGAMRATVVCKIMCLMPPIRRASRTVLTSCMYLPHDGASCRRTKRRRLLWDDDDDPVARITLSAGQKMERAKL